MSRLQFTEFRLQNWIENSTVINSFLNVKVTTDKMVILCDSFRLFSKTSLLSVNMFFDSGVLESNQHIKGLKTA